MHSILGNASHQRGRRPSAPDALDESEVLTALPGDPLFERITHVTNSRRTMPAVGGHPCLNNALRSARLTEKDVAEILCTSAARVRALQSGAVRLTVRDASLICRATGQPMSIFYRPRRSGHRGGARNE